MVVDLINNVHFVGPSFWGLINPDWNLCNSGKRQSPVNVDPRSILYDPGLSEISVDDIRVGYYRFDAAVQKSVVKVMLITKNGNRRLYFKLRKIFYYVL